MILNYPIIIGQSSEKLNPAILANYLFNLAKEYNHFYQKIPILSVDNLNDINIKHRNPVTRDFYKKINRNFTFVTPLGQDVDFSTN